MDSNLVNLDDGLEGNPGPVEVEATPVRRPGPKARKVAGAALFAVAAALMAGSLTYTVSHMDSGDAAAASREPATATVVENGSAFMEGEGLEEVAGAVAPYTQEAPVPASEPRITSSLKANAVDPAKGDAASGERWVVDAQAWDEETVVVDSAAWEEQVWVVDAPGGVEQVWVVDEAPSQTTVPLFETYAACTVCGAEVAGEGDGHFGSSGHEGVEARERQVGFETVVSEGSGHTVEVPVAEVGHYETVVHDAVTHVEVVHHDEVGHWER